VARPWVGREGGRPAARAASVALAVLLAGPFLPARAYAAGPAPAPELDVAQVLERNAAARGGLEAWRKVQAMSWSGYVERADGSGPRLPFTYDQRRPAQTRFEVASDRQRSVRVFDGQQGWKLRPSAGGPPEVQAYGDEERRAARDALVIDGPLLDASAKGVQVTLEGLEPVEGRPAYRLVATLPSGTKQRVWVDAETFLEVKYDRSGRDAAGRPSTVEVLLRDYRAFEGLQLPSTIETRAPGGTRAVDLMVIERVVLNPLLPSDRFSKPVQRAPHRGVVVDTRSAQRPIPAATGPAP
jgi:hypothetical protein